MATQSIMAPSGLLKVLGLTGLFAALLSVNYAGAAISGTATHTPGQLVVAAFVDALLFGYFAVSSRWTGWKEWCAIFAVLYGMDYVLTAMESVYLGSILATSTVVFLLVNGAITSGVFAAALVFVFRRREGGAGVARLKMGLGGWIWKTAAAAALYLFLFILVGVAVYNPLAGALDPTALAQEQSMATTAAALVFPVELIRGALWALLAVPAVLALPFGWRKTALVVGLLMAVPSSLNLFLATSITPGLQVAHFAEIFVENLLFGLLLVRLLRVHSSIPEQPV